MIGGRLWAELRFEAGAPDPCLRMRRPIATITQAPSEVVLMVDDSEQLPAEHAERVHASTGGGPRYVGWPLAAFSADLDETEWRADVA